MFVISKKRILVGLGVVVLLGAAAGAGFLLQQFQGKSSNQTTTEKNLPSSVTKTDELLAAGKTDEANKQINDAVNNPSTPKEEKYILYSKQGALEVDKKNYDAGLAAFLRAEEVDPTYEIAGKIGSLYQLMGNNQKAIEYYKKAIQRDPQSNPTRESENAQYEEMIHNLGGQP